MTDVLHHFDPTQRQKIPKMAGVKWSNISESSLAFSVDIPPDEHAALWNIETNAFRGTDSSLFTATVKSSK